MQVTKRKNNMQILLFHNKVKGIKNFLAKSLEVAKNSVIFALPNIGKLPVYHNILHRRKSVKDWAYPFGSKLVILLDLCLATFRGTPLLYRISPKIRWGTKKSCKNSS